MCPDVPLGNMSNLQMEGTYVDVQKYVQGVQIQIVGHNLIKHTDETEISLDVQTCVTDGGCIIQKCSDPSNDSDPKICTGMWTGGKISNCNICGTEIIICLK